MSDEDKGLVNGESYEPVAESTSPESKERVQYTVPIDTPDGTDLTIVVYQEDGFSNNLSLICHVCSLQELQGTEVFKDDFDDGFANFRPRNNKFVTIINNTKKTNRVLTVVTRRSGSGQEEQGLHSP